MTDAEILAGLTKAQREALIECARFMDLSAGEGIGQITGLKGYETLWADEIVMNLCDAFGIEWGNDFGEAIRALLKEQNDG